MSDLLKAALIFVYVSLITYLLFYFRPTSLLMIQILALSILAIFTILKVFHFMPLQSTYGRKYRWIFLFLTSLFIFISLLSTGGIYSPLLIMVSLAVVGISFFFSFSISVLFLSSILAILTVHVFTVSVVREQFLQNPGLALLNVFSMLMMLPVAYLLALRYHESETRTNVMENQLTVEESILSEVTDLVFVVDKQSNVLSVNDAAERTLRKSKSQLLYKPLFTYLLLKNQQGDVIDIQTIELSKILEKNEQAIFENMQIFANNFPTSKPVDMIIKPIHNLIDIESQLIVIISQKSGQTIHSRSDKTAMTRLNAMIESFKQQLKRNNSELTAHFLLIAKAEKEILLTRELAAGITPNPVPVDIAQLGKEVTRLEQELAQALKVNLCFDVEDQTQSSQTPDLTDEQPTEQAFSVTCDVKYMRLAIEKLLDLGIFMAAASQTPSTKVQVIKNTPDRISITVSTPCTDEVAGYEQELFKQYYGSLESLRSLSIASGLEGYIANTICTALDTPLQATVDKTTHILKFTLELHQGTK